MTMLSATLAARLLEQTGDLICIHALDGQILYVNEATCKVLQYPAEELTSMTVVDLLAADAAPLFKQYVRLIAELGEKQGKMAVVGSRGDRHILDYRNFLLRDEGGQSLIAGIARDVTSAEYVQKTIADDEAHFRSIVESAPDAIAIVDARGVIAYANPALCLAFDGLEATVGTCFLDRVDERDAPVLQQILAQQSDDPGPVHRAQIRLRNAAGERRPYEVATKSILRGRRMIGILINARDITERKLLERQLEQAQRLTSLGRLAATVAHEFNNVLMGMLPFAELLRRKEPSPETIQNAAARIVSGIQRGKSVTTDILRFTQPTEPNLRRIDLAEWWNHFRPEAIGVLGKGIELLEDLPHVEIMGDPAQLTQAVFNLVSNARDAMTGSGVLRIAARIPKEDEVFPFGLVQSAHEFVHVSVSDTGSGIPAEILTQVFDPLFTTKRHGGTGLGLTVALQVAERQGGHLFVESQVDVGTTFHLFLRQAGPVEAARREPHRQEIVTPAPGSFRRVLLVEDDVAIADGLRALLQSKKMEVRAVHTGRDAARAFEDVSPDIVVLDVGLPDVSGIEVAAQLRRRHPMLPILFATGHGDATAASALEGEGQTRLLRKPFELDELLAVLSEMEKSASAAAGTRA